MNFHNSTFRYIDTKTYEGRKRHTSISQDFPSQSAGEPQPQSIPAFTKNEESYNLLKKSGKVFLFLQQSNIFIFY